MKESSKINQWEWYNTDEFGDVQIICIYDNETIYVACQCNEPPQIIGIWQLNNRVNPPDEILQAQVI